MQRHKLKAAVLICAAASLATAIAPASASTKTRSPADVVIVDCFSHPQVRPNDFLIACGDGNSILTALRWSAWKPNFAAGRGLNVVNDCRPFCAAGDVPLLSCDRQARPLGAAEEASSPAALHPAPSRLHRQQAVGDAESGDIPALDLTVPPPSGSTICHGASRTRPEGRLPLHRRAPSPCGVHVGGVRRAPISGSVPRSEIAVRAAPVRAPPTGLLETGRQFGGRRHGAGVRTPNCRSV